MKIYVVVVTGISTSVESTEHYNHTICYRDKDYDTPVSVPAVFINRCDALLFIEQLRSLQRGETGEVFKGLTYNIIEGEL